MFPRRGRTLIGYLLASYHVRPILALLGAAVVFGIMSPWLSQLRPINELTRLSNAGATPRSDSWSETIVIEDGKIVSQPSTQPQSQSSDVIQIENGKIVRNNRVFARISVVDGDTVRAGRWTYRLVGFDAPERGSGARCERERILAEHATAYLQQIVARGSRLDRVRCACPSGTEGTQACNYGRLCGRLTTSGRDVAMMMIDAGFARRYQCYQTSCPPRRPWC